MFKAGIFLFLGINFFCLFFPAWIAKADSLNSPATYPLNLLWQGYQEKNLSKAIPYATGRFKDQLLTVLEKQKDDDFSNHVEKFDILAVASQKSQAVAAVRWMLKYPATVRRPKPYYKIIKIEYHLVFQDSKWQISDTKYLGESYLALR